MQVVNGAQVLNTNWVTGAARTVMFPGRGNAAAWPNFKCKNVKFKKKIHKKYF